MKNLEELIAVLRKALKNDTSNNTREIVSISDLSLITVLNGYGINYEILNETKNIKIFLDSPTIIIFKTIEDAVLTEPNPNLEKKYACLSPNINQEIIFENIISFFKMRDIINNEKLVDFNDKGKKISYFLSPDYGKIDIDYKVDITKKIFYSTKHNFNFYKLNNLLNQESYKEFFKNSICKFLSENDNKTLYKILEHLNFLIDKSENDLNLYKHNFSFDEFKKDFDKDLSDEMKRMQDLVFNFHGKISTIPLQFGAFVYLLSNVKDNKSLLALASIIIICWTIFNHQVTAKTFSNIQDLENGIKVKMESLIAKSGLDKKEIDNRNSFLFKEIFNLKKLLSLYQIFYIVVTLIFLIIYFVKF